MPSESILAIDTSTNMGSVCLSVDGTLHSHSFTEPHSQAAQLLPTIERLLNEQSLWYNDLSGLTVTIGPGSFTGIRIGLAVARTIAFAHPSLTLYPFTTLECLAAGYTGDASTIHCCLRAGKGDIYYQAFTNGQAQGEIVLSKPDCLPTASDDVVLVGNTASLTDEGYTHCYQLPDIPHADHLIRAVQKLPVDSNRKLSPLYIRPPDAALPTKSVL